MSRFWTALTLVFGAKHEPPGKLLGQCSGSVFFQQLEETTDSQAHLQTRELARADIFDYIEVFYNWTRRHSHLGQVSPEAFERASMRGRYLSADMGAVQNCNQVRKAF